jgi:hypothetical protein
LNFCLKIHLPMTTLELTGRGTSSQVLLAIRAANSSSMARRQFGSTRATRTEEGTGDKVDAKVANRVSLSAGSLALPAWSSDKGSLEEPPVRPLLAVTANVEAVPVAPA